MHEAFVAVPLIWVNGCDRSFVVGQLGQSCSTDDVVRCRRGAGTVSP